MSRTAPKINLSFFMFTANLQPGDESAASRWIRHIKATMDMGYTGFDLPIAPVQTHDHKAEIDHYKRLKESFNKAAEHARRQAEGVRDLSGVRGLSKAAVAGLV